VSKPSSATIAATTELSTPPDIATATRVSDADLAKPSEFRCLSAEAVISAAVIRGDIARGSGLVKGEA